ncbi:hypothetical protein E0K89_022350 [Aquicoccus sp. SCR17]|nr:hypothetical protein [Carideicomes alvinocaridis]
MQIAPESLFETPPRQEIAPGLWLEGLWHPPEDGSDDGSQEATPRWTRHRDLRLVATAEAVPRPMALRLRFRVFGAGRGRTRRLALTAPGRPAREVVIETDRPVTLRLLTPRPAPGAEVAIITLTLDRLESPLRLGRGTDARMLGLQVLEVRRPAEALRRSLRGLARRLLPAPLRRRIRRRPGHAR